MKIELQMQVHAPLCALHESWLTSGADPFNAAGTWLAKSVEEHGGQWQVQKMEGMMPRT